MPARVELIVIGGGFTGACVARMAARHAGFALRVRVLEPAACLGAGYAFQSQDPDHRINAPAHSHSIDPDDADHLFRWCKSNGLLREDSQAIDPLGLFIRRRDYARYLDDSVRTAGNPQYSTTVEHIRALATKLQYCEGRFAVTLDNQSNLQADAVVLASGNPAPRIPALLSTIAEHKALIANPWDRSKLRTIAPHTPVVVMGAGLTTADVIASLVANGHRGPITAFSRHGLRPAQQADASALIAPPTGNELVERLEAPIPAWLAPTLAGTPSVARLTRVLRTRITETAARGEPWQTSFDELRNAVWRFWPLLPVQEKRRFLQRLRPWYDVHRFRIAPQTLAKIEQAKSTHQLRFLKARLTQASAECAPKTNRQNGLLSLDLYTAGGPIALQNIAALINCTGFDLTAEAGADTLLGRLLSAGELTRHATGLGYAVNKAGRVVDAKGSADKALYLFGPPTAGQWGDPLGAIFISMQIRRAMPALLTTLQTLRAGE